MAVISRLLQQRHASYRGLLAVEVLALVGLRGLEQAPRLVSLVYLVIAGVAVLLDSPLLPQNRLERSVGESIPLQLKRRLQRALLRRQLVGFAWILALLIELIWQTALVFEPALATQLSVVHLVIWLVLMLQLLWNLINALAEEPLFNGDLLMGAAAGYLLVGFTGGIVLNSLLVLDPAAFNLQDHGHALPDRIGHAPAMLGAAFASLTTIGSPVLKNGNLTSLTASVGITIVGQLYVAILIAGVLGKPRTLGKPGQPAAAPEAEHPQVRRAAARIRLRRPRR
jgi:voltage-gated potassium channel